MVKRDQWRHYAAKGIAAAAAAMVVTVNFTALPLTARAETILGGYESAETPSNALPETPSNAETGVTSGNCGVNGDNVKWEYDADTGTLKITGTGAMEDYEGWYMSPWEDYSSQITTLEIADGVTRIGDYAFSWHSALTGLTFRGEIEIGKDAFYICNALETVTFEKNVKSIGECAFSSNLDYNSNLKTIIFKGEVGSIGRSAFSSLDSLETVTFEKQVKTIGSFAFNDCPALKTVKFGKGVESIGYFAFSGTALPEISFEKDVEIAPHAFNSCEALKKVIFNGNTSIGECAFLNCKALETVSFYGDVKTIGDYAFKACASLTSVTFEGDVPEIGTDVFIETYFVDNHLKGIFVPAAKEEAFKTAWSGWADYITSIPDDTGNEDGKDDTGNGDGKDDDERDDGAVAAANTKKTSDLPSYAVKGIWKRLSDGTWSFADPNGTVYRNQWVYAYNPYTSGRQGSYEWFYFDENGVMVTGWFTDTDGNTYYLNPVSDGTLGRMITGFHYLDTDGDGIVESYYFNEESDGTKGKLLYSFVLEK